MSSWWTKDIGDIVEIPPHVNLTKAQLSEHRAFKEWYETMNNSLELQQSERTHRFHERSAQYSLKSIFIQSVDWWGSKIGFIKMDTKISNEKDSTKALPGTIFLRGSSVAILMIIRPEDDDDERFVIMTQQPRIPAGSLRFYEIPAGMVNESDTVEGQAVKEIKEETGLSVSKYELVDMTALALEDASSTEPHLRKAMYSSPGGSDECISLYLWHKKMPRMEINEIKDRLTGIGNEHIQVKLVKYEELWREGARDSKTLAAWALYEALSREGALDKYL